MNCKFQHGFLILTADKRFDYYGKISIYLIMWSFSTAIMDTSGFFLFQEMTDCCIDYAQCLHNAFLLFSHQQLTGLPVDPFLTTAVF